MHINVLDILAQDLGYSRSFTIQDERPELDQIILTKPINGTISIARLESGLLVQGRISTEIQLECHRCLCTFNRPSSVSLKQVFSETPQDDEMPILPDGTIELGEVIQQEVLVNLPIKILHAPDCNGVPDADPELTHGVSVDRNLGATARIKKEGTE